MYSLKINDGEVGDFATLFDCLNWYRSNRVNTWLTVQVCQNDEFLYTII